MMGAKPELPIRSMPLVIRPSRAVMLSFCCIAVAVLICLNGCSDKKSQPPSAGDEQASDVTHTSEKGAEASTDDEAAREESVSPAGDDAIAASDAGSSDNEENGSDSGAGSTATVVDSAESDTEMPESIRNGAFSKRTLVALAPGGPIVIQLWSAIGTQSVEQATEATTATIGQQLLDDLGETPSWEELLEHPLVASGWLGNLVAEEDQRGQLISMYDTERDDVVQLDELGPFLSRGLARNAPLQISDVGTEAGSSLNESPWGTADADSDYRLVKEEIEMLPRKVAALDFNGDQILALQELERRDSGDMASGSMSGGSMLESNTMVVFSSQSADGDDSRERRRLSTAVRGHYTFLDGIPREAWSAWSDSRWAAIDKDQNGLVSTRELDELTLVPADTTIVVSFPELYVGAGKDDDGSMMTQAESAGPIVSAYSSPDGLTVKFDRSSGGGRVEVGSCTMQIEIDDAFSASNHRLLRERMEAALDEPQLQAFFTNQLQLQEGAFELIDPDEDKKLSDKEFAELWKWLSSRQGTRVMARWMTVARPWFYLLDTNGDLRLSAIEIGGAPDLLTTYDADADEQLTPNELPLLVKLELSRSDQRLDAGPLGMGAVETEAPVDADWFQAMDTNRDGYISESEFLGETEVFGGLDSDKDGFLSRNEVYDAPASY